MKSRQCKSETESAQELEIIKSKPLIHLSPVTKLFESKQGNLYVCGRVHTYVCVCVRVGTGIR